MKSPPITLSAVTMALAATPALAHPGAHLHPHGVDQAWIFAVATLFAAAVGALIARGRK